MTVTGGEPPSFPRIGDSGSDAQSSATPSSASLFTSPDHADEPAVSSSSPATRPVGRGSRLRWLVAAVATLFVFGIVGGVVILAAPRAGAASEVAHYAPADTAAYFETRLDLPGDQLQNLATFMSHFPGFADQSAFQQKLDDTLDSLLKSKTNSQLDWNNDVKPWFGGQLAVFGTPGTIGPMPSCPSVTACAGYASGTAANMAFVLTVSDRSKLEAEISSHLGTTVPTTFSYQGTDIATVSAASMDGDQISYAVTDTALIASPNIDLVKQALDVHAGRAPALANDTFFTQQLGQLHSDRLATFYFDAAKAQSAMVHMYATRTFGNAMPSACMQSLESAQSMKSVGELRAESDHLAFTVRSQIPTGNNLPAPPANNQTTLAQSMPADTIAYVEMRSTGANIDWLIKQELACASAAGGSDLALPSGLNIPGGMGNSSALFEQLLGTTPDTYFDFIGDAALSVTDQNGSFGGGIVATVDDQAVATQRVNKLTSLLGLAGSFGGGSGASGITTEQVQHNGTSITVVHYSPPTGGSVPLPGAGTADLAIATTNGKLYLGTQDFVTAALDQAAASSLGSSARYQKATSAAPQANSGMLYLDVAALRDAREASMTDQQKQQYAQNVKPFLAPLDMLSVVSHIDGDMVIINGFLYVR